MHEENEEELQEEDKEMKREKKTMSFLSLST
jgi:hypothetical protein